MGIAIQELLSQEYFKDFYVLAGAKGLHREIQGITVMEAPDAFHWTKGKELVLSSGYVIAKEPDCIEKAFREGPRPPVRLTTWCPRATSAGKPPSCRSWVKCSLFDALRL